MWWTEGIKFKAPTGCLAAISKQDCNTKHNIQTRKKKVRGLKDTPVIKAVRRIHSKLNEGRWSQCHRWSGAVICYIILNLAKWPVYSRIIVSMLFLSKLQNTTSKKMCKKIKADKLHLKEQDIHLTKLVCCHLRIKVSTRSVTSLRLSRPSQLDSACELIKIGESAAN